MSAFAIILAILGVVLFVGIMATIALYAPSLRRANDGSDQGAEEGWGVINHDQLNSLEGQANHV